jgi:predicted aminopeptidase
MKMKWRAAIALTVVASVAGCGQLGYYLQAAQGQFSLLSSAKPIDTWLSDPQADDELKAKLARVKEIRRFAADELGLPDNASYTTYADLKRSYVLWNVVAAPELALEPVEWCFPIAGCVKYRGYYNKNEAQAFADNLRRKGYDVQVDGVPAYSTLGWFNDPVLSTFIKYSDGELARLVFHELAHQVAYTKGDSQFNESFAVAVEEEGLARWVAKHGNTEARRKYAERVQRKKDFVALLMKHRAALEENYANQASDAEKRRRKQQIFKALQDEYAVIKSERWDGYNGYDRWFNEPLSNAHLASVATYHDLVPGFRALLKQEKEFPAFFRAVRQLASLSKDDRHQKLAELGGTSYEPKLAAIEE